MPIFVTRRANPGRRNPSSCNPIATKCWDVYNDPDYDRSNPEAVKKAKANIKWAEQHDPAVKKAMQKARNAAIEEATGRPASRVVGKLSDHVASLPQQGAYMDLLQSNPRAATDVLGMPLDRLQALDPEAAKDARAKYDKALTKATDPNRPGTTELPGGRTRTVVEQDDGTRIITTIDPKGGTITTRTVRNRWQQRNGHALHRQAGIENGQRLRLGRVDHNHRRTRQDDHCREIGRRQDNVDHHRIHPAERRRGQRSQGRRRQPVHQLHRRP